MRRTEALQGVRMMRFLDIWAAMNLRQAAAVDLAARLGGMAVKRAAIRIEAHRQPVGAERLTRNTTPRYNFCRPA